MRAFTFSTARSGVVQLAVTATIVSLILSAVAVGAPPVAANHTAAPTSVTIAGDLQSELGCPGDWQPECVSTQLVYDADDLVWQRAFDVPAGSWQYKAALNGGWDENYGANATQNGDNIGLNLADTRSVKFYYSHATHWITDSVNAVIATVPGDFQSELGCPGDWDPGCLRSWLQDPDGDGTYAFTTTGLPAGSYEAKVAINEGWDENYGAGGVPGGPNIAFTVPADNAEVSFTYDPGTHLLAITVAGGTGHDNNVEWDGLRHDSRDLLYRTPGGAVPAGTSVTLRFRTFHGDVTGVSVRWYSLERAGQQIVPMELAAAGIGCYEDGLEDERCDFWQSTLPGDWGEDNLWYRFIVTDGTDTDYYADDTPALDGGVGSATDNPVDQSWALMLHVPGFEAPEWAADAVIYQIFPDRFRNGRANNDPKTGDVRYDDPVIKLPWGTKPEGYCRNYADGATNCPWRFDDTPPADSPTREQPRGRDYFGGDLKGVEQRLDYLADLGVTTIYFNPIFDAGSNHSYDTQDYTRIDPYFGTQQDWESLVAAADAAGIRIILDGVFNHLSSDSPFFDRYGHYPTLGACESVDSPYRAWFFFIPQAGGPCVGPDGPNTMRYESWFGFDSIPVINKTLAEVQEYFVTGDDSITRRWLEDGASGWRLDVSGDPSFPDGYWEAFRTVVKETDPDALTISETWQKDSTLLREIRGDRLDTTMNYRLRDAVLGLLAPQGFDSKGFADSGYQISPTQFADRIASVREDYPDAAYYSLMNLLDSHDTERLLWTLTPGAETTAAKEGNLANLAAGKARQRIAALIQFTMPGAPSVFYGDEIGMTGDDDPDDRRTYPWPGQGSRGDQRDMALYRHYQALAAARAANDALTRGDLRILLADDAAGTVAYGRATDDAAAVVAINRSASSRTLALPVAGYLPDGVTLTVAVAANAAVGASATVTDGVLTVSLPALSAAVLAGSGLDLEPPSAPAGLVVTNEAANEVSLAWSAVSGAASYDVYVSPLTGGGYLRANEAPVTASEFTVTDLENGREHFFVVRAVDGIGNASEPSNEVSGIPHLVIGWANLQWPPEMTHTISTTTRTENVYGQVWIDGATSQPGPTPSLRAQLGFGPDGSDPSADPSGWEWVEASFNVDVGNNDEFVASLLPDQIGTFDYAYRYTVTGGRDWVYADLDGIGNGYSPSQAGSLTVVASDDTTAPPIPTGLVVTEASPGGVTLSWDAIEGDPSLHGYEIGRADASGGPYGLIGSVTAPSTEFTDSAVVENQTYWYVVRALDTSFNRSDWSDDVSATTALRTVELTFNVTVPATTDATGMAVHIAGFLDRLDGNHPQWDPGGVQLTRVDATRWTVTFTGSEGTQLEYKYTLGSWDYVEKGAECDEIANRQLTLAYGADGIQAVEDTVLHWRNVEPCGN
jgi:glycosidase/chitodextrinase